MLAGWLAFSGTVLIAGATVSEVWARRQGTPAQAETAYLADLAEGFATTAEAVLHQVEARTGALEALVRQLVATLPATTPPAKVRALRKATTPAAAAAPGSAGALGPAGAPGTAATPGSAATPDVPPLVRQVLALSRQGLTPQAMAQQLNLSPSQVELALRLGVRLRKEG